MISEKARKIKDLIKKNIAPASTCGTNPLDPWSAKAAIAEDANLERYLNSIGVNPKHVTKDKKISHAKSNQYQSWLRSHQHEEVEIDQEDQIDEWSQPDAGRGNALSKFLKSRGLDPRYVSKFQKIARSKTGEFQQWMMKHQSRSHVVETIGQNPDVVGSVNATARKSAQLQKKKSEGKTIVHNPIHKEDAYSDSYAATSSVPANVGNDSCQGPSKAAKLIKSIYKKKVNEDTYDWEKDDKSVKTYGKKPNHDKTDKEDNMGENKPKAAAVVSGGTTLTGEKRDTIEIDPMMRVRPGQPDPTKKDDKKKDKEKQDNKKDK
jgi:hypothetical protein